jgi:putative pyruvate formate lyase activating enzyme
MNQYTPMQGMKPPLDRRVTHEEYRQLTDYAEKLGLKNGFIQEFGTAEESFIPPFDNTGV